MKHFFYLYNFYLYTLPGFLLTQYQKNVYEATFIYLY
jgi:hypothetical protein